MTHDDISRRRRRGSNSIEKNHDTTALRYGYSSEANIK